MKKYKGSLHSQILKLYKKKRNKKKFNKEKFELFLNKLENEYLKEQNEPTKLFVILENYLDGFEKPLRIIATTLNSNHKYIWSAHGGIGNLEDFKKQNLIVHEGIYTVEDLEYNLKVVEEHKKWKQEKENELNK